MLSYVSLVLATLSFIISLAALITLLVMSRRLRSMRSSSYSYDEQLTRDAWLEEIEARGEAVVARIAEAEQRFLHGGAMRTLPPSMTTTTTESSPSTTTSWPASSTTAAPSPSSATSGPSTSSEMADDEAEHVAAADVASIRSSVCQLAEQGMDVATIARRLGIGRDEVELFIGLARPPNDG